MSRERWMIATLVAFLLASVAIASSLGSAQESSKTVSLQPLIDATPSGGRLTLSPGIYTGPVRIDRPMHIVGGGRASVQGNGHGTVLSIRGKGVHVSGLHIRGSGESHDSVDAGILVEGDFHEIIDNVVDDVLFGLHLRGASHNRIINNQVTGKPLDLGMRGDSIRVWNGRFNRIEKNRFQRGRDLSFSNSPDNVVSGNRFVDGRYGMHIVFSPRLTIDGNHLSNTGTGIIVLYSHDLVLRGNHVEHAMSGGGAGIVFKESDAALVEDNVVLHCAVGLKVDAPPEPVGVLTVRNNRFAHNVIGLFFYGEAGGHLFQNNRIENNLTQVALSAVGVGKANRWDGNYWDDYRGFDRNGDGIGDTPHEIWLYADRIWMETPMASFFRNSPSLELLDFLEHLAPFSSPYRVLADPTPRVATGG
jgi:nitrous oxidase accessory protein